jgi:diketogulonate reductase-like aldo/keto reductase
MHTRPIPSTGELLPIIGLGTWQTFDVSAGAARQPLGELLRDFRAAGGTLIDSSPMYGRAEETVGELGNNVPDAFIATKVWTDGRAAGERQMRESLRLLRRETIDLMQVHNLVDWRTHLTTLRRWKEQGVIRYIGITHYRVDAFPELKAILSTEKIDFVQLPLSLGVPDAERELLPLARDRGVAVIVNRPFEGGSILRRVRTLPLPEWAQQSGYASWGELFLRYVVSHPDVTCAIPATSRRDHLAENLRAGSEPFLDGAGRKELRERVLAI